MPNDLESYRQTLLDLYLRLPDTPCRISRHDVRLVWQLWERQIPLTTVETAFLLASVRRTARRPDAIPLGPIRSLHYFLPVIEELLHTPLHHGEAYLAYLRSKVPLRPAAVNSGIKGSEVQRSGGSDGTSKLICEHTTIHTGSISETSRHFELDES